MGSFPFYGGRRGGDKKALAQVIKINKVAPLRGSDFLGVITLDPSGIQVVVNRLEIREGDYAIFLPVGTIVPDDARWDGLVKVDTIEPKTFFGVVSNGVIVPYYWLPLQVRNEVAPKELIDSAYNVGALLGCESVNCTMHFGGSVTAEVINATGEVVGLFSGGEILLRKDGLSHLVGPIAQNGVVILGSEQPGREIAKRVEEFGESVAEAESLQREAVAFKKEKVAQLYAAADGRGSVEKVAVRCIAAGFNLAEDAAIDAAEGFLYESFGTEFVEKFGPSMVAALKVGTACRFAECTDEFLTSLAEAES